MLTSSTAAAVQQYRSAFHVSADKTVVARECCLSAHSFFLPDRGASHPLPLLLFFYLPVLAPVVDLL